MSSRRSPKLIWFLLASCAFGIATVSCRTEREDRPSFYSKTNIAENYGRCPRCNSWVKGYFANDAPAIIMGTCKHCGIRVGSNENPGENRIVTWRIVE